jgi:hypothetical protein
MRRRNPWLVRWAIRSALFSIGLGTIVSSAACAMQTETSQQTAAYERGERGSLDPLTPEEQAAAERIARSDARVRQALGVSGVRLVSAVPVIIKRGESPEKIDLHQRTVEVVLFRPEGEVGARVVVNLQQREAASFQRLESRQVPFTSDDLNEAFQVALRNPEVLKALGPEAQSFHVQGQKTEPGAAPPENEVTGLPVRSNDPKDPCSKHRCMQLLFRHGTDFLSMTVDVDLTAKHATLARRQPR